MRDLPSQFDPDELKEWFANLEEANRYNVFCHCRRCGREWVDSSFDAVCQCGSKEVERISCWQFPDG
jgi:hypothetical protein